MRLPGCICLDVAKIARVPIHGVRRPMLMVSRVEMATGRLAVRRRAIAEFVDVESMLARSESGNIRDHFYFITGSRECDRAGNITPGGAMQDGDRLGRLTGGGLIRDPGRSRTTRRRLNGELIGSSCGQSTRRGHK